MTDHFVSIQMWSGHRQQYPRVLSRASGTAGSSRLKAYGYKMRTTGSSFSLRMSAPGIGILRLTGEEGAAQAGPAEGGETEAALTRGPASSPRSD